MFVLKVEETPDLWTEESARAGTPVTCYDHVEPMQWRHLNVFNKECVIVCALPRGRRANDGTVYRMTPPWEGRSKHFTQEFEAFALTLMREMPVKRAGEILGERGTVRARPLPRPHASDLGLVHLRHRLHAVAGPEIQHPLGAGAFAHLGMDLEHRGLQRSPEFAVGEVDLQALALGQGLAPLPFELHQLVALFLQQHQGGEIGRAHV
mgnify:CR=1 FL=1